MAIASVHVDPMCGMTVQPESAAEEIRRASQTYYFCSGDCAERFKTDPDRYAAGTGGR
jgi:YHS domain-containing protein